MALPTFLVLCILGFYHVETAPDTLSSLDSSFCHGGLEVIYPELDIDKCLIIPKGFKLREKVSMVWKEPQIYFSTAHKEQGGHIKVWAGAVINENEDLRVTCKFGDLQLAELGSIASAALREQRLDISLILIPSRVHSKKKMYVLVMVDPDAPSRIKPTSASWRHWLVVDIQGSSLRKGQIQGTTLTDYRPPTPPQRSGFHRYQFMLFEQPPNAPVSVSEQEMSARGGGGMDMRGTSNMYFFTQISSMMPEDTNCVSLMVKTAIAKAGEAAAARGKWDLQAFIKRLDLGAPVATLQFLTQNYND